MGPRKQLEGCWFEKEGPLSAGHPGRSTGSVSNIAHPFKLTPVHFKVWLLLPHYGDTLALTSEWLEGMLLWNTHFLLHLNHMHLQEALFSIANKRSKIRSRLTSTEVRSEGEGYQSCALCKTDTLLARLQSLSPDARLKSLSPNATPGLECPSLLCEVWVWPEPESPTA